MPILARVHTHQLQIKSEIDVVAVRQEIRQVARDLGLGLGQQAKISAAVSTIARALIAANCSTMIQTWAYKQARRPSLEIACSLSVKQMPTDLAQLEQLLHFAEARALVDEAVLLLDGKGVLLSLRMWLSR